MKPTVLIAGLMLAALATSVSGSTIALDIDTDPFQVFNNGPWNLGYSFFANEAIDVTALGMFDTGRDGIPGDREVTLWSADGDILAQIDVHAGSGLIGNFRYEDLAVPVALTPGDRYLVSALVLTGDGWHQDPLGLSAGLHVAPQITYEVRRFVTGDGGTAFPALTESGSLGYWGGSFAFRASEPASMPEPSTLVVFGLGAAGLVLVLRRRRREDRA